MVGAREDLPQGCLRRTVCNRGQPNSIEQIVSPWPTSLQLPSDQEGHPARSWPPGPRFGVPPWAAVRLSREPQRLIELVDPFAPCLMMLAPWQFVESVDRV